MSTKSIHISNKAKRGFTLIELLVVIAIIGLLASIVAVAVNKARVKARDTRRLQDLKSIETAIQMYMDDNDAPANYDNAVRNCIGLADVGWGCNNGTTHGNTALKTALEPYLSKFPMDPKESDFYYIYYLNSGYIQIWSLIEDANNCIAPFDYLAPESNNNDKQRCQLIIYL